MGILFERKVNSNPSYSSGGGPGEALLLEKRPPPDFPHPLRLSGREREGGAFRRKAASLAYSFFYFVAFLFLDGVEPESLNGEARDFLEGLGVEMKLRGVLGNEDGCVGDAVGLVIE